MPLKRRLTAIKKHKSVGGLTEGLLIKVLDAEMKRNNRTLATCIIKNSNVKLRKDKGTRRNLSIRDLWKICRRSCTQPYQHQCIHFCKGWSHTQVQIDPMQSAEWDGTEHQTYSKASTKPNSQKTIGLGTEIHETRFPIYVWGPCYYWRAGRMSQSLEPEWKSGTVPISSPTGRWRHNVLSRNPWG